MQEEFGKVRRGNSMKILIYQPRASYFVGGGEVYPLQNAKFFAKLGHDVTLLTTKADFLEESEYFKDFIKENPDVKIEYLILDDNFKEIYDIPAGIDWTRWDRESLWVARLAYEYLNKYDYDIIAVHNVIDTLAVPFNKRHILELHGSPTELNYICKFVLEREKKLIAVSQNVKEKWIKLGASPNITICTNAIDDTVFVPDKLNKRELDLLYVGRLIPVKGVQYILEALKLLKDKYDLKPNLKIIGKGPYMSELEKISNDLKVNEQVTFAGYVSQEELIESYQSAKIAVLPSYDKEGIMSTLLEAASCMTPSITTRGTSMEEFAKENENALLVAPSNAEDICEKIYMLLTNENLAKQIASNAYTVVKEDYTWLSKAKELIKIYEEV